MVFIDGVWADPVSAVIYCCLGGSDLTFFYLSVEAPANFGDSNKSAASRNPPLRNVG